MKSAGTISISIALRSIVVSIFGVVLMFMTSPLLSALTLACLPVRPRGSASVHFCACLRTYGGITLLFCIHEYLPAHAPCMLCNV